jgi:N,N'-diacetyllegionaminate synthase
MKIIAELCQNHNGSFDLVKSMVDAAAGAGATHVKIQTIYADTLVFRPQFEEGLIVDGKTYAIKRPWLPEYQRLKGLELSPDQSFKFVEYCRNVGVIPLTTCFARKNLKEIYEQGFREIKVASYDCASYQLIKELAKQFSHLYISTGATFDDEVECSASILKNTSASYSFLHCVTLYPTPIEMMHLSRISWLRQHSNQTGFSDHSFASKDGLVASMAAVLMGAEIIERHFTILPADETRDGPVSINAKQLKELSEFVKLTKTDQRSLLENIYPQWEIMIGNPSRQLTEIELLNRDYYRGRFATPRTQNQNIATEMIFNWEQTPI